MQDSPVYDKKWTIKKKMTKEMKKEIIEEIRKNHMQVIDIL